MSTTALLHGLRVAQHLTTEAASYGVTFSNIQVHAAGDLVVHLDGYLSGDVFASHLLDTLDLHLDEFRDFPTSDMGRGFRATTTTYRGVKVDIFGTMPAEAAVSA